MPSEVPCKSKWDHLLDSVMVLSSIRKYTYYKVSGGPIIRTSHL